MDRDYSSLGNADKDKFELHLRNLCNHQFDKAFVTTRLKITFPESGDYEICQIEIKPATKAVFVKLKDKSGQTVERFYVRSGNSSQELTVSELDAYTRERFH